MKFNLFGKEIRLGKEYIVIGILLLLILLTLWGWYLKSNRVEVFIAGNTPVKDETRASLTGNGNSRQEASPAGTEREQMGDPSNPAAVGNNRGVIQPDSAGTDNGQGKNQESSPGIEPNPKADPTGIADNGTPAGITLQNKPKENIPDDNDMAEAININTAGVDELTALNGIGAVKAQAIISYRNENGLFKKIEDIKNVKGIGEVTFDKIKDRITVGAESAP